MTNGQVQEVATQGEAKLHRFADRRFQAKVLIDGRAGIVTWSMLAYTQFDANLLAPRELHLFR